MTKSIWSGVCTAIVGFATAAITAQTTTPQPQSSTSSDRRITVTGCLKEAPPSSADTTAPGTAGTTGTAGTAGTAGTTGTAGSADAAGQKFVLTDATPASGETSGAASATTEPTNGASSTATTQTYRLVANPASLSPHVGKKLELTGTLVDQDSSAKGTTESSSGSAANAPALKVESGKVIAASCPQ